MAFKPPVNRALGTYVTDGVRSGPYYNSVGNSSYPDVNNNNIVQYFDKYGPGVLFGVTNAWSIVPYASSSENIVAATAVTAAKNLTLLGDNGATTLMQDGAGNPYVQFDWPRVPAVVVETQPMSGPTNVTIFGSDWYGFPMQHTYTVQNVGVYPANLATPAKAFYRINRIYCNNTTTTGTIAVQTTSMFGLPYVVKETGLSGVFSWNDTDMHVQHGVSPAMTSGSVSISTRAIVSNSTTVLLSHENSGTSATNLGALYKSSATPYTSFTVASSNNADDSQVAWFIPRGGQNLIAPAVTTTATATTGDVRGLVQLPENGLNGNPAETWSGGAPNGVKRLVYMPYIFGADQFQNQLAAGGQPQGTTGGTVPALTWQDLYGVAQYYTGSL